MDHTENFCDVAFDAKDGVVDKGWGPNLRVTEWKGRQMKGDRWLRGGEDDDRKFRGEGELHGNHGEISTNGGKSGIRDDNPLILVNSNFKNNKTANPILGGAFNAKGYPVNPIFEESDLNEGNDQEALEMTKRKRLSAMQTLDMGGTGEGKNKEIMEDDIETDMEEEDENNTNTEANHFLPGQPISMIILSWNCRGLGHSAAIPFLRELVRVRKPDALFLCENLCRSNKIDEIKVCLGYDCAFTVNCVGRSRGWVIIVHSW